MVEAFFADKETRPFQQPLDQVRLFSLDLELSRKATLTRWSPFPPYLQGIESVRSRAAWLAREQQSVQTWLDQKGFSSNGKDMK